MATTLEVIRGISQVVANTYDGGHDEKYAYDGTARKVGLVREEGDLITDSRVMDGFGVRFHGHHLIINYQYDCKLKHVHESGFEDEITSRLNDIAKYLRSEYQKVTGNSLALTKEGDCDIMVEYISRVRTSIKACQVYKIGGLGEVVGASNEESRDVDSAIKSWLAIGKDKYPGTKKASNVKRKND
jgi:hypothetical protein